VLSRFALISGLGWLIDFSVFSLLCQHWPVYMANLMGASLAVLFVFFASLRPVFLYAGQQTSRKLLQYIVYQVVAIWLASLLIDALSVTLGGMFGQASWLPLSAKVIVTPLTFVANFMFMRWLSGSKA
jgi:putative flippase GtrA